MRAHRVVVVAALAVVLGAGGCTPQRVHGGVESRAARAHAPAPANPDLGTVMERFYQQVEGAHWPFAYAMLSARYRARMDQDGFVARYAPFSDMDVSLLQRGDRVVIATIRATERAGPARASPARVRRFQESVTLAWDGEDWRIDDIVRRDVTPVGSGPSGTR